jgi:hypothetical protein
VALSCSTLTNLVATRSMAASSESRSGSLISSPRSQDGRVWRESGGALPRFAT